MSIYKGGLGIGGPRKSAKAPDQTFRNPWPNAPDFTFDYSALLSLGDGAQIGDAGSASGLRIAIIGGGVAGLTCMRELVRCGFENIDLFEADGRIGGRNFSVPYAETKPTEHGRYTAYELGAMRFPLFNGHSAMSYYLDLHNISTQSFPDPGTVNTGIWINQGRGTSGTGTPQDIDLWEAGKPPPSDFTPVWDKWNAFSQKAQQEMQKQYDQGDEVWLKWFHEFLNYYRERNFLEISLAGPSTIPDSAYLGGLDMTAEQARLFYTIGAGDGSWGAFFALSCMYPFRTLLCGFGEDHRLIQGRADSDGAFDPNGPQYGVESTDSVNQPFAGPNYIGIQSLAESQLYTEMKINGSDEPSLYSRLKKGDEPNLGSGLNLFVKSLVEQYVRIGDTTTLGINIKGNLVFSDYDIVICTPPTWAVQTSMPTVFSSLPSDFWDAYHSSHWITSCKVFYALSETYWNEGASKIPQIIVSDTALQDSYGYRADFKDSMDPGVLLVSYTWEDDATKLIADEDPGAFSGRMLGLLSNITTSAASISQDIKDYITDDGPVLLHWSKMPYARGCAKLYHPGAEFENYNLLMHNQNNGKNSGLYLAGEACSVYGGWTEPALRHALDAVVNILNDTGGTFKEGFSYSDYSRYPEANPFAEKAIPWAPKPPGK